MFHLKITQKNTVKKEFLNINVQTIETIEITGTLVEKHVIGLTGETEPK